LSPDRKPKPGTAAGNAEKHCVACGRTITWRKKWERDWEQVKYCSDACRGRKPSVVDALLEAAILRLLDERGAGKTICPSEAARVVAWSDEREKWEPLMEPARAAARRLVAQGRIVVTQGGVVVDASRAKGAIRLRRV